LAQNAEHAAEVVAHNLLELAAVANASLLDDINSGNDANTSPSKISNSIARAALADVRVSDAFARMVTDARVRRRLRAYEATWSRPILVSDLAVRSITLTVHAR
jgi:hypothetical protein